MISSTTPKVPFLSRRRGRRTPPGPHARPWGAAMAAETIQGMVSVLAVGAKGDGNTNDTVAIQNAINQGFTTGAAVFFPAGVYRVSQLVLKKGTILQGVSSGTYPDNNTISGASVLARLANSNKDLLLAPDGANYCRIFDLAVDGNRNNNTSGYGLCVADSSTGS